MTTNNYPVVKVEIDEAKELAEHAAVVQDLGAVMETCRRIEELIQQDSQDRVLIEGLWTAALVRYCRCFAKAKRKGIDETIFNGMKGEPLEAHKY